MPRDGTDPLAFDAAVAALEEGDGTELIGCLIEGRYRLEAMLGRGGMGLVYRAAHVGLRRQVAVKILHPSLAASTDVRSRFEREALAVGKIDHPNCVSTYDVGRLPDGSLYLAMELLDGRALAEVLEQEGQLAPGRALHILAGILRGLSHVHAAGMIHRDIKPENVFLIRQGADEDFAKILDFGIAKPISGRSELDDGVRLTQAGMAFGTPIYMAPEQALGNPMDGRADLYAAAVLGYEMLCGQPPFYSDDKLEVMSMHTARPVPAMRARLIKGAKPVPSSIERLIARGLTKQPGERYATADVFLAAVESALRTPDGGVTDVTLERHGDEETGARALTFEDGQVRITGTQDFVHEEVSESIASAIDEAIASAPVKTPRSQGPDWPGRAASQSDAEVRSQGPAWPGGAASRSDAEVRSQGPAWPGGAASRSDAEVRSTPRSTAAVAPLPAPLPLPAPPREARELLVRRPPVLDGNQSLARALEPEVEARPKRKRWALYGGIAAIAIAAGIAIAVLTIPSAPDAADGPDPSTPAGRAYAALERTEIDLALSILTESGAAIASDPQGQFVLGLVHAYRNDTRGAVTAFAQAMRLDPALREQTKMRSALRTMADAKKDPVAVAAAMEVWSQTGDPDAKPRLLSAARSEHMALRRAAQLVIKRLNLHNEVNWVESYGYDLQQEAECGERKKVVAQLRALEDPRAIPALEQAIARKGTQGRYANKPINGCLVDDAQAAITYLRGLSKSP